MLEHIGTFALEMSRRGFVTISFDVQGGHESGIKTGDAEDSTAGGQTVLNAGKSFNFVDWDKIAAFGYSMGGMYASNLATANEEDISLLVTLGTMPSASRRLPSMTMQSSSVSLTKTA